MRSKARDKKGEIKEITTALALALVISIAIVSVIHVYEMDWQKIIGFTIAGHIADTEDDFNAYHAYIDTFKCEDADADGLCSPAEIVNGTSQVCESVSMTITGLVNLAGTTSFDPAKGYGTGPSADALHPERYVVCEYPNSGTYFTGVDIDGIVITATEEGGGAWLTDGPAGSSCVTVDVYGGDILEITFYDSSYVPPDTNRYDYGDAPTKDDGNHFNTDMTAYPQGGPLGTNAYFPTVFSNITDYHIGPCHIIDSFWLGVNISGDGFPIANDDADQLSDEDGFNLSNSTLNLRYKGKVPNLNVTDDTPNLDRYDDGLLQPLNLINCTNSNFKFKVTADTSNVKYANAWFDWNRDGDWNDTFDCGGGVIASEWAVRNQDVTTSGTYNSDQFIPYNPNDGPTWMRLTLSPNADMRDNGRGPNESCMVGGETEDYYIFGCQDLDGDGFNASSYTNCGPYDCDDNNADVYPGALEVCNDIDDDCDGLIDEVLAPCEDMVSYWRLNDQSGFDANDSADGNHGELKPGLEGTVSHQWPGGDCSYSLAYGPPLYAPFGGAYPGVCPVTSQYGQHDPDTWIYLYSPWETGDCTYELARIGHCPMHACSDCPPEAVITGATLPPQWVEGHRGTALEFAGDGDYIQAPATDIPSHNQSQSILLWYNVSSIPSGTEIFVNSYTAGSSYINVGFQNGSISVWRYDGTSLVNATPPSELEVWHFVVYTYDENTSIHRLYIDGVEVDNSTISPDNGTPSEIFIGKIGYTGISSFEGRLDEIAIYDYILNISIIGEFYDNLSLGGYCGTEDICNLEFLLGRFNYCGDEVDDDEDTRPPNYGLGSSCVDNLMYTGVNATSLDNLTRTDCWANFESCGPCPSIENYTYESCADGINNDYDAATNGNYLDSNITGIDCADLDCLGELASYKGTNCTTAGGENTVALCTDGVDNDADGDIDSADGDCPSITPDPYVNDTTLTYRLNKTFFDVLNLTASGDAIFYTGDFNFTSSKTYTSEKNCMVSFYNEDESHIFSLDFDGEVNGNNISCDYSLDLADYLPSNVGVYFLKMSVNHTDGYLFNSSYKLFYVCNSSNLNDSYGVTPQGFKWNCRKADFDNDGWTEGIYTTLYTNDPVNGEVMPCDACPGQVNTGQDSDADGIDDVCDTQANLTLVFPEGVYEPLCCSGGGTSCDDSPYSTEDLDCQTGSVLRGSHLHTFSIVFENVTAPPGPHSCDITKSDGTTLELSGTHGDITGESISLNYTIPNETESVINRSAPWRIKSCLINYGSVYVNNSINQPLYVHSNNWTGSGEGFDASRALGCYGSQVLTYFNNTVKCDWAGDVIFALHMADKTTKEVLCHDGQDNDLDGDIDCADSDCLGISYFTCPSQSDYFTNHPFLGGYTAMSKSYTSSSITGYNILPNLFEEQAASCSSDTNICTGSFSAGSKTINYKYTYNVQPSGTLKVKFDLGSSSGFTSNMINDIPSFSTYDNYPYATGAVTLDTDVTGAGSVSYQTKGSISGTMKQVMYVNYSSGGSGSDVFELVVEAGGVPAQETGLSFTKTSSAPSNWDENHSALPHVQTSFIKGPYNQPSISSSRHSCNDREDNDLDFENINDCRDLDCDGEIIGVTVGNDLIRCEHDGVEDNSHSGEVTCWDGYDNDHDNLVDCADPDCDERIGSYIALDGVTPLKQKIGASTTVLYCEYNSSYGQSSGTAGEGTNNYSDSPSSCDDRFNNDADEGTQWDNYECDPSDPDECYNEQTDCYDRYSCWGRSGTNSGICPLKEDTTTLCQDNIDNDYDDRPINPSSFGNWLGIYNPRAGSAAQNRTDCLDYDCYSVDDGSGNYLCSTLPTNITEFNGSFFGGATCFDGLDNDLDWYYWNVSNYFANSSSGYDCQDPDCANVINPANPLQQCLETEFKLGYYDFCRDVINTLDDDFDGKLPIYNVRSSCVDNRFNDTAIATSISDLSGTDCWAGYQVCGPCPSIENYTYESCADNSYTDYDSATNGNYLTDSTSGIDCADDDCLNELGSYGGAICKTSENNNLLCSDEFDNDAAGGTDCGDLNCAGYFGSDGQICEPSGETSCADTFDNDRDSYRDCADFSCDGISGCIDSSDGGEWNHASCITVPLTASGSVGTANYQHLSRLYINEDYTVRIYKTTTSNNPVISIAANDGAAGVRFPYDTNSCTLNDGGAGFVWLPESTGYSGIIQYGGTLSSGFDITLTCTTPGTPQASQSYVLKYTETGEISPVTLSTQLYENTAPSVSKIQVGGNLSSDVTIKYGGSLTFKAKPSNDPSGICGCTFELDGDAYSRTNSFCRQTSTPIYRDIPSYIPKAFAEDGASNIGNEFTASPINVKVIPIDTTENYRLDRAFYNESINESEYRILDTGTFSFITGQDDTFSSCNIHFLNGSKDGLQTFTANTINPTTYEIDCSLDLINLSNTNVDMSKDGIYFIYANSTDSDGDPVNSSYKVFYVCNNLTSSGVTPEGLKWTCQKADLDNDGWTEGLYTTKYSSLPTGVIACDSCPPPIVNTGLDSDGDGIDDACDNTSNLTIWDTTDFSARSPGEDVVFYANFTDDTGATETEGLCAIFFDDMNASMTFNPTSGFYEYTRSFSNTGTYFWNVSCAALFVSLTANDTATITLATGGETEAIDSAGGARRLTVCAEEWNCSEWENCQPDGKQTRICYDLNNCDELYNRRVVININRSFKPETIRDCIYDPTCYDNIFNGNESDLDCGGLVCPKCEDDKSCRIDEDCINLCNETTKLCYSQVRLPVELRPPLALIVAMLISILLIVEVTTYKYQREYVHNGIENYKKNRAVARRERTIKRKTKEAARRKEELRKQREELIEKRRRAALKAAETRRINSEKARETRAKNLEKARERKEELKKQREEEAEARRRAALKAAETRRIRLTERREGKFRATIESIEAKLARLKGEKQLRVEELEKRRKAARLRREKLAELKQERLKNLEKARETRSELAREKREELEELKEERLKNLEKARERKEELKLQREKEEGIRRERLVEQNKLYQAKREGYTQALNNFFNQAVNKGYGKPQIKKLLVNKGWPKKMAAEYVDNFFESNQESISNIKIAKGDTKELIKVIKERELSAKKRLQELEDKLLEIDKKIARR